MARNDPFDKPRGLAAAALIGWALMFASDAAPTLLERSLSAMSALFFAYLIIGLPVASFVVFTLAWPLWLLADRCGIRGVRSAAIAGAAFAAALSLLHHAIAFTVMWLYSVDEGVHSYAAQFGHATFIGGELTAFGLALVAGDVLVNACIGAIAGLVALHVSGQRPQPSAAPAGLS